MTTNQPFPDRLSAEPPWPGTHSSHKEHDPLKPHSPEWEAVLIRYRPKEPALRKIRNDREEEFIADAADYGDLPASAPVGALLDILRLYQRSPHVSEERLWTDQNIYRVATQMLADGTSDWKVETFTARMRRIGRNKNARPLDPPKYSSKKQVKDPYPAHMCESWWDLVASQPKPATARNLAVVLCVSTGSGASAVDLRLLRFGDIIIDRTPDRVTVDVWLRSTRKPRRVPVAEPWAARLADTIGDLPEISPGMWAVGDGNVRAKNLISNKLKRVRWGGQEPCVVARLRTTWIADRLSQPVRVDVIQEMLGLSTLATVIAVAKQLVEAPTPVHYEQLRAHTPYSGDRG